LGQSRIYIRREEVMKVKVGDKIYNGEDEPVMVILTDSDKKNIANMLPECTKYAMYPDEYKHVDIEEWMGIL
jgi:hypothetical protein